MSDIHLSKKDWMVTTAVLFVAFVAIPVCAWQYSSWRLAHATAVLEPSIELAIRSHLPDQATLLPLLAQFAEGTDTKTSTLEKKALTAFVRDACDELIFSLRDTLAAAEMNTIARNCGFTYQIPGTSAYLLATSSRVDRLESPEQDYLNDLAKLLADPAEQAINFHTHDTKREIHVLTSLSKDPVLVWDIIFSKKDRSSRF